jgi:hypothetical protein
LAKGIASLSKVTAPQADGMPKQVDSVVMHKAGSPATTHNMPQAQNEPKMTGTDSKNTKKEKTADGYTQKPMVHNMAQADGTPVLPNDKKLPSGGAPATKHNMPADDSTPVLKNDKKLPSGGAPATNHNMPQTDAPKMPAAGKLPAGGADGDVKFSFEHYIKNADRFLKD